MRDVLKRYHEVVAQVVIANKGHVAKLLGDGVLAYFGWPHAQEVQAEQAIHAALDATRAVSKIKVAGKPLMARAGIATGEVVIGDMIGKSVHEHGAVAGETPNLAARLQGLAKPGEVVINDVTQHLTSGLFLLEDGGEQKIKGFANRLRIWRVKGKSRTHSRFEASRGVHLTEFIGRKHEIGLLVDRWTRAKTGEGQVVLMSGEAGIGKSRIMREFTSQLDGDNFLMLRYQCSPHEINTALYPVIAEIEFAAKFQSDDTENIKLGKLQDHLNSVFGEPDEMSTLIAALLSLPVDGHSLQDMAPQRRKQRTIDALVNRILLLSQKQPVILVIEDVHWIDPSCLEMLDALVEQIQETPVFMVVTHREEFTSQWGGYGHVTAHSLNRLGRDEGRAITERITGGKALPSEVLTHILEHTDGIPLFVEELTRMVLETEILDEKVDCYELNGPLPSFAIPTTLHDSLMARLDRMSSVKRVIQAAACIGREFGANLLLKALSIEADELEHALNQLLSAQLIFRRGNTENGNYIFKHALVQDIAYSSLLVSTRRALHKKLALALERHDEPDLSMLARHFAAAGKGERAANLYLTVGQQLLAGSALSEAIGALELGLQEVGTIVASRERDSLELNMRVALGTARMVSFGWAHPSVSEALEPAYPLAIEFNDQEVIGSILWGLWVHYQTRTNFSLAHDWLAKLKTAAEKMRNLFCQLSMTCRQAVSISGKLITLELLAIQIA